MTLSGDHYRALVSGERRGLGAAVQRLGLWAVSLPYGWAVRVRNRLYDAGWKRSRRVSVPVVSIGNLTLGGTGKTPFVEYVAGFYRKQGRRVAILSRGYGSARGRNDEALVLEANLPDVPHLQGADRVGLAGIAVEELESEVLVLDDGFQHRRLARDLDVVLVDATNPWGHGRLFPRGLLREAVSGLRRAGILALTRCDQVDDAQRLQLRESVARWIPEVPVIETYHRPVDLVGKDQATASLERIVGPPVAAFCGLGNPAAFRRTLTDLGVRLADFRTYPDHHAYTRSDEEDLGTWARQQAMECVVVTTQKDLVKLHLSRLGGKELWALRIRLQVETGQDVLDHKLRQVLKTS